MGLMIDGTEVRVEIAPDSTLWAVSPAWEDISDDVRSVSVMSSGRTTEYDQSQPGSIDVIVSNRARRFDLTYGPAMATLDGTASNYWATPDKAAFAGASALDVRFAASSNDWTPASNPTLIAQYTVGTQQAWRVFVNSSGHLALWTSANGSTDSARSSGVVVTGVDGQVMCCRVTWDNGTGQTRFWIKRVTSPAHARRACQSDDGWMQLGATASGVTHSLFNSTSQITIGSNDTGGNSWAGDVLYAQVATAIDGAPDLVWWPKDAAATSSTSWVSSVTGETWTRTGSAGSLSIQGEMFDRMGPGTPVRVVAERDSTDYPLGYGYLRRAPQEFPGFGTDAVVRLSALDGLGWLQDVLAPETPGLFGLTNLTLGSYWPLHEPLNTLDVTDVLGVSSGRWTASRAAGGVTQPGAPTLVTGQLVEGTSLTCPTPPDLGSLDVGNDCVLRCQFYLPTTAAIWRLMVSDGGSLVTGICYGVGGLFYTQAGNEANAVAFSTRILPGWHTFEMEVFNGFTLSSTIDGVQLDFAGNLSKFATTAGMYLDGSQATVSDIVLLSGSLPSSLGPNGGAGQVAAERMAVLLDEVGIDSSLMDLATDTSTYLGPTALGVSFGELCAQVNTAEQGRFFQAPDGVLTFRSRAHGWTATTATVSQATYGENEIPYAAISIDPGGREEVANDVTITLPDGTSGSFTDAESVAEFGRRTASLAAPLASPAEAASLAAHIVGLRAWPQTRITALTFNPLGRADVWDEVLARAIGERVTVVRRPTDTLNPAVTTAPTSADVCIERVGHTIDRSGAWATTFLTTPAPPTAAEAGYFTLDDTVLGVLDAGNSLAY